MNFQVLHKYTRLTFLVSAVLASGMATSTEDKDAQRQKAFEKARLAYDVAWQRAPLDLKTLAFVVEPAQYYGQFEPRVNSTFTDGESMVVYFEPTGFGHGREGEFYTIDLDVGMELRTPDGKVLLSTNTPERVGLDSKTRNLEFQTSLIYSFQDLPTGQYILYLKIDDANTHKKGNFELPFSIQ